MSPTPEPRTTRVLSVDPLQPDPAVIEQAAEVVRSGGLVAFPTETVYGLGANALDGEAAQRIFAAKGRPADDPLIVHVADMEEVAQVASHVPERAVVLMRRFWPGPLTLVLPRAEAVPDVVTSGGPTVAVRCPDHPVALALLRAANVPIAAPSANRFAHTSPTAAQHVLDDLDTRIDLVLDGGACRVGVESTVVDVTGAQVCLLRPGGVTLEELEAVVGRVALGASRREAAGTEGAKDATETGNAVQPPAASPGLLDRHYAPHVPLHLFRGRDPGAVRRAMCDVIGISGAANAEPDERIGLLAITEDLAAPEWEALVTVTPSSRHIVRVIGSLAQPETIAQNLFAALRELEAAGLSCIIMRDLPGDEGLSRAIRDRLQRAAEAIVNV